MEKLFIYGRKDDFEFSQLPKGDMVRISMNPYNGNVFIKLEKHQASSIIALELLREIVRACNVLESVGSDDPLRELMEECDGENWDLFRPGFEVSGCDGRSGNEGSIEVGEMAEKVKKAS